MSRQDNYNVTLTVNGRQMGTYDKMEGGELDSDEVKYRSGNMGSQRSLGGPRMVGNITLTDLFEHTQADRERLRFLLANAGHGAATVVKQPLDADGNANVDPLVYTGTLKTVTPGPVDSNSNEADTYDLVISAEGDIG